MYISPDPRLHEVWRDRIRRQEASGLSIRQFCSQEGIGRSIFHAWKRHFRLAATEQRTAPPSPSSFLPVRVHVLDQGPTEPQPIEADLPNGVRLRIPTTDPRLACRIIRTVAAAGTNSGGSR